MANSGVKGKRGFGDSNAGRAVGTPNKVTTETKQFIKAFTDGISAKRLMSLFERLAKRDPEAALNVYAKLCEYSAPKLARTEHVGDGGGPQVVEVRCYGAPPEPQLSNDAAVLRERDADEE